MCLVAFALNQHPDYPLILIANRDEFFARPTQELHRWDDYPEIYGGRDLEAKGTWLAINRHGRWAALTNFRDPTQATGSESRGNIVLECLTTESSLVDWFEQLRQKAAHYSGFNLVAGELPTGQCIYYSNQDRDIKMLPSGLHAISNGKYDDDWPKMQQLRSMLEGHVKQDELSYDSLFNSLKSQDKPPVNRLPNTGIPKQMEEKLATPFIQPFSVNGQDYGTRSSAILMIDQQHNVAFCERSMDLQGNQSNEILLTYHLKYT